MTKKERSFSLKDQLFNPKKVEQFAQQIKTTYSSFNEKTFIKKVVDEFPHLELKERITHMAKVLKAHLPKDYEKALKIILKALPPELDPTKTDDDFGDFIWSPFGEFIALYGCSKEHYALSMEGLKECTKRFSAEGPIRSFINAFPEKTYKEMKALTKSKNYHQRRLASEGSRLKLPWAQKIGWAPEQVIEILDQLYADKTRYVTRSVANSLNDISKVNPPLVLQTLEKWKKSGTQEKKEMQWMIKHSLRTLLKKGNAKALAKLGFTPASHVAVMDLKVSKKVKVGDELTFSFKLLTKDKQLGKLRLEYVIDFVRANGKHGPKVFKIAESNYSDQQLSIRKKHSFKKLYTRDYYPGEHAVSIVVNGRMMEKTSFELS